MSTSSHQQRFEQARDQFSRAVARLAEVAALDETDVVRDALIQRFEFSYELARKSLFYCLRDQGEQVQDMARPILQAAFRAGLLDDPDLWDRIKNARNETSHTYNEAKAIEIAAFVREEALPAMQRLEQQMKTQ
ncbi:HI0074 family nucleotidyltransferase substrate-binding subunit [Salinisphaera sp. P385]|uniref:HI0074 family nucleotidyltransferase substrate-binding subunit n=1 Tax=Spectribacter acetivorans TaxID=3075603 RepID=A0ABU3BBE4_9GAMM|nr:HI0074 family nucleotidyltransferase substrate-binding subunit [Salinisphaera sp. P385]MDT0618301.1 HI0074 family nucleotidyltransferase substrate-binding subunit [Salinisphaera sp. P385]